MKQITSLQLKKIVVKYSILTCVFYIFYFLLMRMTGLAYHTELRLLNYAIYLVTGYFALSAITNKGGNSINYVQGIGISFVTGSLSFILFGVFIFFYSFIDLFFINTLNSEFAGAEVIGRFAAPFLVASEGIGISSILSLCLMQYFKIYAHRNRNKKNIKLMDLR